jgi:hypothetical protein
MAIHNQSTEEGTSGWAKTFEAGAESILLDLVQSQQYQFPIKSAIRELTSNAIDSIREKEQFFLINANKAKVEDFYIQRDGPLYADSNYNPDYYQEKWLSKEENRIKLIYKDNGNAQRDTLHIIDPGVGLGGRRMEKSFNPLFSTKRNTSLQTGKFGVGSKSGLALETDYYTMITRYNGMEFHFQVYNYKVDSIVPKLNTKTGKANPSYKTEVIRDKDDKPLIFHYLKTELTNGVEVILQAKKGLKKDFIDGVKGQLLYMDGIDFELWEDGNIFPQDVKADIEYEDDIFVLPSAKSTYYSKPHLILNNVCYGYVDFLQMEEEDRVGNIGMKINPSLIDINPNRESVRWTEKTRDAIHATFKEGEKIAERLLNEALVSEDLFDWALKSAAATGGANNNSIVGRFANIVDIKNVKPKFTPMPKIQFWGDPGMFMRGYDVMLYEPEQKYSKAKHTYINSFKKTEVFSWSQISGRSIFYFDVDVNSFRTNMWLLGLHSNGFIQIRSKGNIPKSEQRLTMAELEKLVTSHKMTWEEYKAMSEEESQTIMDLQRKKWKEQEELMDNLIRTSKFTELYSSVKVPEDFKVNEKEEEESDVTVAKEIVDKLSDAERRKLEDKIVVQCLGKGYDGWKRGKREPTINEIIKEKESIIYGFQEDEQNLTLVHQLLIKDNKLPSWPDKWNESRPRIIMVSQSNAKYFKHHMYVDDFFMNFNPETSTISMHNKLVKWQTARKLNDMLPKIAFLQRFGLFDDVAYEMYRQLIDYRNTHYVNLSKIDGEMLDNLQTYTDKVTELQLFISKHPGDSQAIAAMSKALFDTDEDGSFKEAVGVDLEVYENLLTLLEHTKPIATLFNEMAILTHDNRPIVFELEQEIKGYLQQKGYIALIKPTVQQPMTQAVEADLIES